MSSECQPYINTQSRLRDSRPSSSSPSLTPSFSSWTILAPFCFPLFHTRGFLFPRPLSSSRFENSLRFCFIRPPVDPSFVNSKEHAINRISSYIYIETYDDSFSNWRTVSKNLSLRLTLEYIYIHIQALNRRMNQIETFSFPPTFLIYILLARSNEFTLYTTRKQYYLGRVLSWRRNGRPDYYAVFAP